MYRKKIDICVFVFMSGIDIHEFVCSKIFGLFVMCYVSRLNWPSLLVKSTDPLSNRVQPQLSVPSLSGISIVQFCLRSTDTFAEVLAKIELHVFGH